MEFDFTTILYILFGILYFAFTGASKNRKKRQGDGPSNTRPEDQTETLGPPPMNRKPTFEELLEEFTTGRKPDTQIPEPVPVREVEEDKPLFDSWYEEDRTKIVEDSAHSVTKKFERFEEFEVTEASGSKYGKMLRSPEGIRDAFVLQEILTRKY